MRLWRIARRPYADLTGNGGLFGSARWHCEGAKIIYTAVSAALAGLEYAVNASRRPLDTQLLEIDAADNDLLTVEDMIGGPLPGNWAATPEHTRPLGMAWISEKTSVMLSVPSIVVPTERNVLLNPDHPGFARVTLVSAKPFFFDPRIFK
jgi:RES domain-containing protein